MSTPCKT